MYFTNTYEAVVVGVVNVVGGSVYVKPTPGPRFGGRKSPDFRPDTPTFTKPHRTTFNT